MEWSFLQELENPKFSDSISHVWCRGQDACVEKVGERSVGLGLLPGASHTFVLQPVLCFLLGLPRARRPWRC